MSWSRWEITKKTSREHARKDDADTDNSRQNPVGEQMGTQVHAPRRKNNNNQQRKQQIKEHAYNDGDTMSPRE